MAEPTKTSSLAIVPDEAAWPAIQDLRRVHDSRQFPVWPPHINLFYPFVPEQVYEEVACRLAEATSFVEPLKLRFSRLAHFRGKVAYLVPDCQTDPGLTRLYDACLSVLPECRGLQHRGFTPHLTVGQFSRAEDCYRFLETCGPVDIEVEISFISLLARDSMKDPFRTPLRIRLGAGDNGVEVGSIEPYCPSVVSEIVKNPSMIESVLPAAALESVVLATLEEKAAGNTTRKCAEDNLPVIAANEDFPSLQQLCDATLSKRQRRRRRVNDNSGFRMLGGA